MILNPMVSRKINPTTKMKDFTVLWREGLVVYIGIIMHIYRTYTPYIIIEYYVRAPMHTREL